MSSPDHKDRDETPHGFSLDVWCPHEEEIALLRTELAATDDSDTKRSALLLYELGRVQLSAGNELDAAQALLQAYKLRPQFRPTLQLSQTLYRQRADYKLTTKLLDAEGRATRDPLTRASLLRQQARLLWSKLNNTDEAQKKLEQASRLDPTDLATLKLEELLYAIERQPDRLRAILLRQHEAVSDVALQTALLVEAALLLASTDPMGAIGNLRTAEKEAPVDLAVLCALEQICELEGMHEEQVETLVRQASDERASSAWRARQLARAGRIQRDQANSPARAIELFQQSLALHSDHGVAADCFDLMQQHGQFAEAAKVGQQLFKLEQTGHVRAALACQIGDIYRIQLQEPSTASIWYRHCLGSAPSYQPALEGLGWILEQAGEVDDLLEVHNKDLENTRDPHARAQRLYRIATVLQRHGRDEEAFEAHQQAMRTWPGFMPSFSALQRLYTRHEKWSELLSLLEEELVRKPDRERAIHMLETMASIWDHQQKKPERAIECYQQILARDPGNLQGLRAMARLCAESHRWQDLVNLNEREVGLISETARQSELLHRTGEVWEEKLLNLDEAMNCYRRALRVDPRNLPALKALGRLYRQKRMWPELIQMHQAEIHATDDPTQILALLFDIAETYEEQLLDETKAITAYRAVLQRSPGHLPAINALLRILRRRSSWPELLEVMESTLDAISDDRGKALRLWAMGLIRQHRLDDAEGAVKDYSRALRLGADLAPIQATLEQLLDIQGDHDRLADLYSDRLEHTESPEQRTVLAHKLATLLDHTMNAPRQAAQRYELLAQLKPTTWDLWSLVQIYQKLGLPRELCSVLEQLAETLSDEQTGAEIHLKIGQGKLEAGIGDPIAHFKRTLELPSGHQYTLRTMERIHRNAGRHEELSDLINLRLQEESDPTELACLWTELAEIHLRRSDVQAAEHAYRQALGHSETHISAIWGLGRLLEQQKRWNDRAQLAEVETRAMESNPGIADALFRAAVLWEERAGDVARAVSLYQEIQRILPGNEEAYQRLHAILTRAQDWSGLASLIRSQITADTDHQRIAIMFIELGRLYIEHLEQPQKGEACLRRALELNATNTYALMKLGDINYDGRNWNEALRMYSCLEPLLETEHEQKVRVNRRLGNILLSVNDPVAALAAYKRAVGASTGRDPDLLRKLLEAAQMADDMRAQVVALEQLAECSQDQRERIEVRKELARLAESVMDNDELAIRTLEETLILDPLDIGAIEQLAAIYGRASNRSAANQHLQAAVAHHRAELARRPFDKKLYRQLGRIFQWQRQFDRLYCACVVQRYFGELDEVQERFLWNHHRCCGSTPRGTLRPDRYETHLLPEAVHGPLRKLLSTAGNGLQKRAAVSHAKLGLDKNARLKDDHPVRALCDEIAGVLGGVNYELWISRANPDIIAVEMLGKPSLILGLRVARNVITPAERFRIGKALFLIAENALVLRDLSVREIGLLFAALGDVAQPRCSIPLPQLDPEEVQLVAKDLVKVINRRERKQLGALLPHIADQVASINLAEFARALSYGSNRAGLVAAGDTGAALEEAAELVQRSGHKEDLADLLLYIISDEYFALREELGITPGR